MNRVATVILGYLGLACLLLSATACGGRAAPPQEERSAEWTAGDDAPLAAPAGDSESPGDSSVDAQGQTAPNQPSE